MKRSTDFDDVRRRSLISGIRMTFFPLLLAIGASCCDAPISFGLSETPAVPAPRAAIGLRLDSAELRALSGHTVALGARVLVAADSGDAGSVSESEVSVRDSSVAGIDGEGMLYALGVGQTWVTWSTALAADSSLLIVADDDPATDQLTYVAPAAPKATVDVRYPSGRTRGGTAGKSVKIAVGGNLQNALDEAQPGDEIILASGATFTGNFVLPAKPGAGSDWIIVRAEAVGVAAGTRMTPTQAANAARIVTPNQEPALRTANGARRWRLVGLQIEHAQNAIYNYGIIVLGRGDEKTVELQPSDIVLDRMYIHGSTTVGNSRCIAFNGRSLAVIDSWISECHAKGNDAQGICGWNGGGPFLIENNYIEGSGQAIMFGGADPVITNVSPSDITIRHNYLFKPLSWGRGVWTVKAAFELKHGKRVLFEGNIIENHWIDAQAGYAILFQTLADNNSSWAWTTVQDVMVRNNVIKNSTGGANIAARVAYTGGTLPTNPTSRVVLLNNLWQDIGIDPIAGTIGRVFMILGDHHDVSLVNNTITLNGRAAMAAIFDGNGIPAVGLTIANNVFPKTEYGFLGSGAGVGTNALNAFAPGSVFLRNVIPALEASLYPASNFFPATAPYPDGTTSERVCQQVKTWLANASMPSGIGADCDVLEEAVRNVMTPGR